MNPGPTMMMDSELALVPYRMSEITHAAATSTRFMERFSSEGTMPGRWMYGEGIQRGHDPDRHALTAERRPGVARTTFPSRWFDGASDTPTNLL